MARTPDRAPGPSIEEELQLEDRTTDGNPTINGAVRFINDDFVGKTSTGVVSLTTGAGLNPTTHRGLDQLVHRIAENSHTQITRVGGKVTNITIWTTSGMTTKIRETQISRASGKVSQIVEIQYDASGSVISGETNTQIVNRVGGKVDSIDSGLT